ncbi:Protein disulfide-isomerase LQY1, chloroplastic [Glycine soja]
MTVLSPSLSRPKLQSSFLCCPLKYSKPTNRNIQPKPTSYPRIRALDLDQNTVVAISVGVVSVAVGIGIPVFYETQIDNAVNFSLFQAKRENTQPCFPCNGSGARKYFPLHHFSYLKLGLYREIKFSMLTIIKAGHNLFCLGNGNVTVELGGGEEEVSRCINCDGVGSLTCTTCQGSGIQPRYLDRREFKDDD